MAKPVEDTTTYVPPRRSGSDPSSGAPCLRLVATCGRIVGTEDEPGVPPWLSLLGDLVVGRAAGDDGALSLGEDRALSRRHARFCVTEVAVVVHDMSTNGTWHNGVRIAQATLADGDIIRCGDSIFLFRKRMPAPESSSSSLPELVGISAAIHRVRTTLALLGPTTQSVLLLGPSGSGKEVCAAALHRLSGRAGPWVALNSAALPEHLVESELFGHKKGAFSGATDESRGAFRAAHRGTLFLDEIGELSSSAQAKLLRALETKRVRPVGSAVEEGVDVRVVAATHRDLPAEVRAGRFRADLYARLAEVVVRLPALAERREDVLLLLQHFLGEDRRPVATDLVERLLLHPWPLQVREVRRIAQALRLHAPARFDLALVAELLDEGLRLVAPPTLSTLPSAGVIPPHAPLQNGEPMARTSPPDREALLELLSTHAGNVVEVARATGRSRKQVYRWLQEHDIDPQSFRR